MPTRPEPADAEPMSQTSVRFPRMMLKRAKIRAATDEISLQALLISALNAELERRDKVEARKQARRRTLSPASRMGPPGAELRQWHGTT